MNLEQLLTHTRSCRRFDDEQPLDEATLRSLVALTRLCPSGANRQPLKYYLACTAEENAAIFPHLGWAKWLPDWPGPAEDERPAGYVVILGDPQIAERFDADAAIAAHTILLGATAQGLGGCMIAWVNGEEISRALALPDRFRVVLVVALGHPKETVVLEEARPPGGTAYWRDAAGVHHVPKRPLEELLVMRQRAPEDYHPVLTCLPDCPLLSVEEAFASS